VIEARPGAAFDAFAEAFAPGLAGVITVSIYTQEDVIVFGPSAAGITEIAPIGDLARYGVTLTAPEGTDTYLVVWDDNQPDPNSASEELHVTNTPTTPAQMVEWITGADVEECCPANVTDSSGVDADRAAAAANGILYELSGEQFYGEGGPIKARPGGHCHHWSGRAYSGRWYGVWGAGRWSVGCPCLSVITLAPYPIREIVGVKINGSFIPASSYRLDKGNELVRLRDVAAPRTVVRWPGCQIGDLPDTEPGTWSVTYTFGADPPTLAVDAAKELACEILRSCDPDAEDCAIPKGTTRVTRAGLTIEMSLLAAAIKGGSLGLPMVDLFLGTYNPDQLPRPSAVWSPDIPSFPRRQGF
jgi:hypothetical protein